MWGYLFIHKMQALWMNLIKYSDIALDEAKNKGICSYAFYDEGKKGSESLF